jgi:hypothetical protein
MLKRYAGERSDIVAPEPCCSHLRCKSMYHRSDERPGMLHPSDAMDYWCHHTNAKAGPDGAAATHSACQSARACHAAAVRPSFDEA